MSINIDEVRKIQRESILKQLHDYCDIMDEIEDKIYKAAEEGLGQVSFNVDKLEINQDLLDKLRKYYITSGFNVSQIFNVLVITWANNCMKI